MQAAVPNKQVLLNRLTENRNDIRSFGVKQMGIFGSFVLNTAIKPTSDVDLLVE